MGKKESRLISASLHLYRWLLRLEADEFYNDYAQQAQQVFHQCCLDAYKKRGAWGVLRLWPGTFSDTLKGVFIEQSAFLLRLLHPNKRWPVTLALVCVLFPFFWLSRTWTWFGYLFNLIFSTPLAYFTGHVTLFCLAGLSLLLCVPALRQHPRYYTLCLMAGAFAEEYIQILFNSHPGIHKDMRNLLLDLSGILLAYLLWRGWHRWRTLDTYGIKSL